jgi:PAS domain S-box-containing protein
LGTFGFLVIVLVFGSDLADQVARASHLASEVAARDERWGTFFRKAPMLMIRVSGYGTVEDVNPFALDRMRVSLTEVQGREVGEFIRGPGVGDAEDQVTRLLRGEEVGPVEGRLRRNGGEGCPVLWSSATVTDGEGGVTGVILVGADLTDRVAADRARDRALEELRALKAELEEENLQLRAEVDTRTEFDEIIGESSPLKYVLDRVKQVAPTDTTVVVEGETGVGKELVARAIHRLSERRDRPFVRVNCAALPATLIESELFGHERGAFTGATAQRLGRFELADGGSLLLDEVAELPLELQSKLLRVLQDGEFERVGSSKTRLADVRVLAATNRSLTDEVAAGRFRQDLFFRLQVYPITVPPLRERREDIPALVSFFVRRFSEAAGRSVTEVPKSVMRRLLAYHWPGNVRELQNVLERAVILTRGSTLELPDDLLPGSSEGADVASTPQGYDGSGGKLDPVRSLDEVQADHIRKVLAVTEGRVSGSGGAAEILGLHPNTLRSRMKKLGIDARTT